MSSIGSRNFYFDSEKEFKQFVSSDYRAVESETFSQLSNPPPIIRGKIPAMIFVLFPEVLTKNFSTPPNNLYRIVGYWEKELEFEDKLTPIKFKVILMSLIEEGGNEVEVDAKIIRGYKSSLNKKIQNKKKYFTLRVENLNFKGGQSDKDKIIRELELRKDEIYFDTFNLDAWWKRGNVLFEIDGESHSNLTMTIEEHRFGFLYYNVKLN